MDFTGNSNSIYPDLLKLIRNEVPCALALITGTTGSAPQVPGCSAVIGATGLLTGTVGGGMVEMAVIRSAKKQLEEKQSQYFQFNLDNDSSLAEEAICGGNMNILVDATPEKHAGIFELICHSLRNRKHGVLITEITYGSFPGIQIFRHWYDGCTDVIADRPFGSVAEEMFKSRKSGEFREIMAEQPQEGTKTMRLLETIVPPQQLIIAGAGHVGKAVSHLGKLLGFEVTVWDDREEYANNEALPDAATVLTGPFHEASAKITITHDTFIVIVTRGHKNDAEVLKKWISSEAAYIGMIGSKTKIARVRDNLILNRWATGEQWKKIHSPIGLPIGSKTVQEIAVSIAAQLVQERYRIGVNG